MRTRTILAAAPIFAAGTLLGWLRRIRFADGVAQEKQAGTRREDRTGLHPGPTGRAHPAPPRRRGRHLGHAGGQLRAHVPGDDGRQGGLQPGRLLVAARSAGRTRRSRPTPTRSTSSPSSTRRTPGRWCWRSRRRKTARRSPAAWTTPGRWRWRTSARPAWTRARAASTSSCRRATRTRCPTGTSRCRRRPTPASRILRSNLKSGSDADVAKAVAYGKRVKFYPLSQAANPPATTFVDAIDVVFDSTIPYDLRFFESLDRFVQREPWLERDKAMIDSLKTIGIEKGKPFKPDAKTQKILDDAVREAQAWLDHKYEGVLLAAVQRGHPLGAARHAGSRRRHADQLRQARRLPRRGPRRHLFHGLLQRQAHRRRASTT